MPIKKLFIANRGEIALRIIRSAREMGITTVVVYSDADHACAHRLHADYALRLTGTTLTTTYLHCEQLVSLAVASGCDTVHPGYGFLAENSDFAQAVITAGLVFVGPTPEAMRMLGDKLQAKRLLAKAGIPVVAGSLAPITSLQEIDAKAEDYPLLLKAALGGGGKGIRLVKTPQALAAAFAACQREAVSYFADKTLLWERLITKARHIEVQILADTHGNALHLYERDCSIQRRYQKLVEEAPSTYLTPAKREEMGEMAVKIAKTVNYSCAGTVEFICETPARFYFMEVNARIQVEHPVTEMVTGIDLIKEQLRIASGERLAFTQEQVRLQGHAIEVRINCEDPQAGFAPCPNTITDLQLPSGAFTRVDTHIYRSYSLPKEFDSLLAKLICWGQTRSEALARLQRALGELHFGGVKTTAVFHRYLCLQDDFIRGDFATDYVETLPPLTLPTDAYGALLAVVASHSKLLEQQPAPSTATPATWQDET